MSTLATTTDREAEQRLARALKGRGGRLTRADAEALTGLPAASIEPALTSMLATYRSHLAATESGELLYAFDPALTRRDAEPLRVRLERAAALVWRGFVVAFKIAIVAVLVIYFLLFLALLIGLTVARLSASRDDRDSGEGGGIFPLWLLWWLLPWDFGPAYGTSYYGQPRYRRPPRRRGKKVHQQVFDFVFGPPQPKLDPGAADRQVLAYIRAHRGRITAAELVALRGIDLAQAEDEATRLMCDYNGEPEVTEDGEVIYVFRELRLTAGETADGSWTYAWEQLEQRPVLTGNSTTADVVVSVMNGFNLIAPFLFVPAALVSLGLAGSAATLWLQVVPVVFSGTFFAIPLGRAVVRAVGESGRRRRNRRRLLLAEIYAPDRSRELTLEVVCGALDEGQTARALGRGDPAEEAAARRDLRALVVPLGGDVVLDATDERQLGRLTFPRLAAEMQAVEQARARAPESEAEVGAVVFDSAARELEDNPEMKLPEAEPPHGRRLPPN